MKTKRPKYSLTYTTAVRTYSRIMASTKTRQGTHVVGTHNSVSVVQTGQMESYSKEDVTITDSDILDTLSHRALQLCVKIIKDLQFNNALWYFDHTKNTRDAMAIKELRDRGVLEHTEDTRIHFVNPDIIRKGNKLQVAGNTALITEKQKVCRELIRPLNKRNIELNPMHIAELG